MWFSDLAAIGRALGEGKTVRPNILPLGERRGTFPLSSSREGIDPITYILSRSKSRCKTPSSVTSIDVSHC